ncbi:MULTISPECIES: GNAT family N-acetyltransferase [unclassified Ensifer]|uniref:GNAT family N-acetyltransferase n=1 Tax=unclassified Ensifer TaxID=2633371 RepID=UPI00081375BE|nr:MULTISPECIES: GNAT family N-acetyltransferase [unclassified Ensifer]OCP16969.1 acetyltransferase [Ensifer sp. LC163]OCP24202.1 acetyltransferase [Ensifer sp. LC384]OCP25566.1 acetyltransferase [Ensifer sp. LC54]
MRPPKLASLTAHVTELEMTTPPKQSLPMPVNIHTAILRVSDIPLNYYRFLYLRVGKRWHWADRIRMSDKKLAALLADKRTSVTVLYVNGAPAGFFELHQAEDDVVELTHFGLMEHALGLGLGKWFLLQTLFAAWTLNPSKVTVTTNNLDHPRALQLYQQFGFSPVATREATVEPLTDEELLAFAKNL